MQFRDKQIAPPKDWGTFENLCHALFKRVWNSPYAQKNGRRGQKQHGVDIFGTLHSVGNVFHGVQCKGKDATYGGKPTLEELKEEIAKANTFSPRLEHWIFATTAPADATIQQAAREISVERKGNGLFTLDVLGWEEIQALMADVPQVIEEFYPEHAANLPAVLETLRALPSYGEMLALVQRVEALGAKLGVSLPSPRSDAVWLPVEFENGRDLGPALMGRPLGPADAAACPRLVEADIVLTHLKSAYSVQIVGEPGAGKSVCAYQASMTLAGRGFDVLRLTNPQSDQVRFEKSAQQRPRLFLIDNAHLMSPHVLKALEDDATGERLLISIHNALEESGPQRGAIVLDSRRAVRTIASALRANLSGTLKAVRRVDDQIGERMLDADLGQRIDDAEREQRPWQFCFVLGGGWRRARQAADAARAAGADIILAVVAMHQLASRDAVTIPDEIISICGNEAIPASTVMTKLTWLEGERLLLSMADCRCPHQRFSAVVLKEILVGQDREGRERIGRIANAILRNTSYPLAGLRLFLHELRFGSRNYWWTWIVQDMTVRYLAKRCWNVASGEERTFAALVLEELSSFSDSWATDLIAPHAKQFSSWISDPTDSAYGFGYLLNYLVQNDAKLAAEIVSAADPVAIAKAFSHITLETAYGLSDLMRSIGSARVKSWNERLLGSVPD